MRNHQPLSRSVVAWLIACLAVVFFSSAAPAMASDAVVACDISVFSIDPDQKGSNVRSGPGAEHSVLAVIADQDSELEVTGVSGKWLRIRLAEGVGGKIYFKGEGWVFAALTGVNARNKLTLRAAPDASSAAIATMAADDSGVVLSCSGEWVQVQIKKAKGWMAPDTHCGNPVTTCN